MPDNLTLKQRSYCMSQIKGKDTKIESLVRSELHKRGYRFRKHVKNLPGKPDIAFRRAKVAVFIDGDFWHGYDFENWQHKVSDFWKNKIAATIERDKRNHAALEEMGWTVIRIWQHDLKTDFKSCIKNIINCLG